MALLRQTQAQKLNFQMFLSHSSIEVNWIKKQRKHVGIRVIGESQIQVSTPLKMTKEEVITLIHRHEDLLINQMASFSAKAFQPPKIDEALAVSFLGEMYAVEVERTKAGGTSRCVVDEHSRRIRVRVAEVNIEAVENALNGLYKQATEKAVAIAVHKYSVLLGVNPSAVQIKVQKRRWGSCNSKGEIRINFRAAQGGLRVIDYLVVHELSHLKHMNHSKAFWLTVQSVLPDYLVLEKRLKQYRADGLLTKGTKHFDI